jgi:arabinogalactan endo-1,4-beta-galactosidase
MLVPLLAVGALALAQCHNPKIPLKNRGGGGTGGDAGAAGSPSGEAGEGQGGTTAGGTTSGGSSGSGPVGPYMMGVDISSVQEAIDGGATYVDTDGATKDVLELFKNHGFNTVRLRTFVDPGATYGYATGTGGSCVKRETYCDLDHTLEFGRQIKDAGMGFLLDFHYSDTWADPGKQIIPEAWRGAESIEELAALVKAYTKDSLTTLIDAGARPDIVQVGNEITPGMLIHVPGLNTDCWGNNSVANSINGSASRWDNLAPLLIAGIEGVKEVDAEIQVMLHLENTDWKPGAIDWVENALSRGVEFDILGLSAYPAWQGEPAIWRDTFETLADTFPKLSFVIAEYGPERREANRIMRDLPDGRGRGTFLWEPTQSGVWGASLFTLMNGAYYANHSDFAEFDEMKLELGL